MSKLKENIDRILGSSLRCLLPSYWWKRIFGLLVDEIDDVRSTANSKANKSEVASLFNSVDALSDKVDKIDSGNNITVDSSLSTTSTNPVQNKVVTEAIKKVVPTFGITKTQGFAEYFLALSANQSNPNMYPRGIVIYENAQSEVDNVISLNNGTEIGIEFSVAEKRYRWVFNRASSAFIREEEVSSGSSTAGGLETRSFKSTNSTTDKEWNKETISLFLEGKVNIVCPYPTPNGVLPEGTSIDLMPNTHIYQNGTHQFCFTEQHPFGGHTDYLIAIQSDGTYDDDVEEFKPNTEMSDTSTNTVQNKVIKKYVDGKLAEIPVVTVDSELSDTSENAVQNKVIKAYVDELNARLKTLEEQLKTVT